MYKILERLSESVVVLFGLGKTRYIHHDWEGILCRGNKQSPWVSVDCQTEITRISIPLLWSPTKIEAAWKASKCAARLKTERTAPTPPLHVNLGAPQVPWLLSRLYVMAGLSSVFLVRAVRFRVLSGGTASQWAVELHTLRVDSPECGLSEVMGSES